MKTRVCCDRRERRFEGAGPCVRPTRILLVCIGLVLLLRGERCDPATLYVGAGPFSLTASGLVRDGTAGWGKASAGGHGVMFADVTGDGLADLYLTRMLAHPLTDLFFRNAGQLEFVEEATQRGIADLDGGSHGSCWADLDNDGDYDLVNGTTLPDRGHEAHIDIFRNDGVGRFTDVTAASGIPLSRAWPTRAVLCLDMDVDGDLDIFAVSGYLGSEDDSSERNEAYWNEGNLRFTPLRDGELLDAPAGQGATDTDYDGDGDIDLIAANRTGVLNILSNNGRGSFTRLSPASLGIRHDPADGISVGDVDGDCDMDILLTRDDYGQLYRNDGTGRFSFAQAFSSTEGYMGAFADLDNDTDLDLVFAGDNTVYLNTGSGTFVPGPSWTKFLLEDPRAIAFADLDADGDPDFAIGAKRSESWVFLNGYNSGHWLRVRLVSPDGQAGAFGARTAVYAAGAGGGDLLGCRESRSSNGYLAQDEPVLHFGVGPHRFLDVVVTFLDGSTVTRTGVAADQTITIDGRRCPVSASARRVGLESPPQRGGADGLEQ